MKENQPLRNINRVITMKKYNKIKKILFTAICGGLFIACQQPHNVNDPLQVLCLGNSITKHPIKEDIEWFSDWGMAASNIEYDYCHQLEKMLCKYHPNSTVTPLNIASWERNLSCDIDSLIGSYCKNKDIIIIRLVKVRITALGFPFLLLTTGGGHLIRADGNPRINKNGKYQITCVVCITNIAARICPMLCRIAPQTLTNHKYRFCNNRHSNAMPTRHNKPPLNEYKQLTSVPVNNDPKKIRRTKTASASRTRYFCKTNSVIIFASPSLMPGIGTGTGICASTTKITSAMVVNIARVTRCLTDFCIKLLRF